MRGHPGVKEHSYHKPRNALPGGLADELARNLNYKRQHISYSNNKLDPRSPNDTRFCERAQCDLVVVGITLFFLSF